MQYVTKSGRKTFIFKRPGTNIYDKDPLFSGDLLVSIKGTYFRLQWKISKDSASQVCRHSPKSEVKHSIATTRRQKTMTSPIMRVS